MALVRIFGQENSCSSHFIFYEQSHCTSPREWRKTYTVNKLSSPSFHFFIFRVPIPFIITWNERERYLRKIWVDYPSGIEGFPVVSFIPFFSTRNDFLVSFCLRIKTRVFLRDDLKMPSHDEPCWLKHRSDDGSPRSHRLYCSLVYPLVKIYDREDRKVLKIGAKKANDRQKW